MSAASSATLHCCHLGQVTLPQKAFMHSIATKRKTCVRLPCLHTNYKNPLLQTKIQVPNFCPSRPSDLFCNATVTWCAVSDEPAVAAEQSVMMGEFSLLDSAMDDATSEDSDPAALVEDALLGELFFQQLEAQCQVLSMT